MLILSMRGRKDLRKRSRAMSSRREKVFRRRGASENEDDTGMSARVADALAHRSCNNNMPNYRLATSNYYRWWFPTKKRREKKTKKRSKRKKKTTKGGQLCTSHAIVRKHTCNVQRQLRRRNAHGAKRVLMVSPRAPAFSSLVYLCKYSSSIYNNTRYCARRTTAVVAAAHATAICCKITVIAD